MDGASQELWQQRRETAQVAMVRHGVQKSLLVTDPTSYRPWKWFLPSSLREDSTPPSYALLEELVRSRPVCSCWSPGTTRAVPWLDWHSRSSQMSQARLVARAQLMRSYGIAAA